MTMIDTAVIGKMGGDARAASLSAEERSASARKAARARWKDHKAKRPVAGRNKQASARKRAAK
jgi:hypothetical protein